MEQARVMAEATTVEELAAADHGPRPQARGAETGWLWAAASLSAALGTAICFDAQPGMSWGIWTTGAGTGLLAFAGRGGRRVDAVVWWAVGLAVIVSWGAAVTANDMFHFFILTSCVVLLATATRVAGGLSAERVGALEIARGPLVAFGHAVREAGRRSADAASGLRAARSIPVMRGLAFALPVAAVFALILAGADPVLGSWRDAVVEFVKRFDFPVRAAFFGGLGILVLGAYGLAVRGSGAAGRGETSSDPTGRPIGPVERRIIVGAVGSVFGVFLLLQLSYFFRNTDALRVSGMSYTEYAHQGFGELTVAATLCLTLLVALDRYAASGQPARSSGLRDYWGSLVLIAEVLVVLASAFYRISSYEAAYGYTALRLYVQAYVVGVGVALMLLASEVAGLEGAFDSRRAARRAAVVAALFLAAFSFANPEGFVVARNMDRYRATGKLDGAYLASGLSLNAAPAVVAALGEVNPTCAGVLRRWLDIGYGEQLVRRSARPGGERWFEWNARRGRGLAALRSAGVKPVDRGQQQANDRECGPR